MSVSSTVAEESRVFREIGLKISYILILFIIILQLTIFQLVTCHSLFKTVIETYHVFAIKLCV